MNTLQRRQAQAILGLNVRYALIPAITGATPAGAVVTSGAGVWGVYKDIAAAGAITAEFWICGFNLDVAGAVQAFSVDIRDATPTTLTQFVVDLTAVTPNIGYISAGPYPIRMAPSAQVQARSGGAAAKVLGVSMLYATGL